MIKNNIIRLKQLNPWIADYISQANNLITYHYDEEVGIKLRKNTKVFFLFETNKLICSLELKNKYNNKLILFFKGGSGVIVDAIIVDATSENISEVFKNLNTIIIAECSFNNFSTMTNRSVILMGLKNYLVKSANKQINGKTFAGMLSLIDTEKELTNRLREKRKYFIRLLMATENSLILSAESMWMVDSLNSTGQTQARKLIKIGKYYISYLHKQSNKLIHATQTHILPAIFKLDTNSAESRPIKTALLFKLRVKLYNKVLANLKEIESLENLVTKLNEILTQSIANFSDI